QKPLLALAPTRRRSGATEIVSLTSLHQRRDGSTAEAVATKRRAPVARIARPDTNSPNNLDEPQISVVDVKIRLKMLRRFLVRIVLHNVEFAALLVDYRAGLNFAGTLLHGRFVLGSGHLSLGLVQPLSLGADHISLALADGPRFRGLRIALRCLRDRSRGQRN